MLQSIRSRLLFLALSGGIVCLALAGIAWYSIHQLHSSDEATLTNMAVVRNHMEGDMMHDALRGDVLNALLQSGNGIQDHREIDADVAEHSKIFREALARNAELPLSAELHATLLGIQPKLDAYIASAEHMVQLAFTSRPDALAAFGEFDAAFGALETAQGDVSDQIEAITRASQAKSQQTFERTQSMVTIAILVALGSSLVSAALGIAFARGIVGTLNKAVEVLGALAQGDFTRRLEVTQQNELGRMATSLNEAVAGVSAALNKVGSAAERMSVASNEVSSATVQLSDGSQQQASALEETAASLEEITGTVKQNADSARQANQLAAASREVAEKGGRVVADAVLSIQEISKSSEKIANIITTIDEIAFQTNLLALNAAVEAARAGEQGRGFAVVASEVRSLAQRSATSAKEIKALIEESLHKVQAGSELVSRSGQSLDEIVASVKRVTDIIAEIAAASQEQATGVEQVNRAVTQMDQVVQSTAGQASELAATAQGLASQSHELQSLVGQFKLDGSAGSNTFTRTQHATPAPVAPRATPRTAARRELATAASSTSTSSPADDGFIEF